MLINLKYLHTKNEYLPSKAVGNCFVYEAIWLGVLAILVRTDISFYSRIEFRIKYLLIN